MLKSLLILNFLLIGIIIIDYYFLEENQVEAKAKVYFFDKNSFTALYGSYSFEKFDMPENSIIENNEIIYINFTQIFNLRKSFIYNLEISPVVESDAEDGWIIFAIINGLSFFVLVYRPRLNKTLADWSSNHSTVTYFNYVWLVFMIPIIISLWFWYLLVKFIMQNY